MNERFNKAVDLFNTEHYFEAHEAWEDEWRESAEPERRWLQGLVQAAVALHHRSTGNLAGAGSVMKRAIANLSGCPDVWRGIDIARLRRELDIALAELKAGDFRAPVTVRRAT
ncbi:MAG TPA: DUF309 domain-containing protein [Terriglobales bacterium]|nr:DUF309 domain-containing protein [Terriglobales bacterium]